MAILLIPSSSSFPYSDKLRSWRFLHSPMCCSAPSVSMWQPRRLRWPRNGRHLFISRSNTKSVTLKIFHDINKHCSVHTYWFFTTAKFTYQPTATQTPGNCQITYGTPHSRIFSNFFPCSTYSCTSTYSLDPSEGNDL